MLDELRDIRLPLAGIRLEDWTADVSVWSYEDSESILKEFRVKEEREAKAKAEKERKKKEEEEMKNTPPEEYFKKYESKDYS